MAKSERPLTEHEQEIEGYIGQMKALEKARQEAIAQAGAEGATRIRAERERDETRAQFTDLKERLHNAEIDNAVMRGYLDRVGEDDHASDGFFEVADGNGEVTARPKRKGYGYRVVSVGGHSQGSVGYSSESGERSTNKRRVHWTSY